MEIIRFEELSSIDESIAKNETLLALIAFDGSHSYVAAEDEAFEHYVLLKKVGLSGSDIDKYFRIVFDRDGADWTCVCPPTYKNIADKGRRTAQFYKDGYSVIPEFLERLGYLVSVNIPARYGKHIKELI